MKDFFTTIIAILALSVVLFAAEEAAKVATKEQINQAYWCGKGDWIGIETHSYNEGFESLVKSANCKDMRSKGWIPTIFRGNQ